MGWSRSGRALAGSVLRAGLTRVNPLPVQPARIHCPPPRDDTLSRERLNSWLDGPSAGRLALIVAEAGLRQDDPARGLGPPHPAP